ncbi:MULTISPECIES: cell wall metabolism sensor histidine kinase WalK [Corynebacterium]|uniref:Sensor-like histidine kinase SenX3 n=1 Tax=Corynebacterium freneyi TaxID=134034 RepID=A0ABS4UAV9_9CORY|nr:MULTISPECIES: ATP-binding protein [Corynebacterium]MBP2333662.1 two-component system sensor histidine kinase SenX3 [Corynebacterium freneyi]WJZ04235.1 Signal-transduction histidine kinase senX3 [Corynebacterium freneyi]
MTSTIFAALVGAAVMAAVLIGGGAVTGVVKAVTKKRSGAEERVTTIAQVLHLAIQGAPTGIVVVDISRDVLLSNPQAHQLGLMHERVLHDLGWEAALRVFDTQEEQELNLVIPARRAGAPDKSVRCLVSPLTMADDRFVVLYATDESELVRMEAARRDFVANVSHELKTPVGAMSLLVEALAEAKDDPEAVEHFSESLTREAKRLSTMITELISLSKLQGAEALPDMEPLKVSEIVDAAVYRTKILADQAGISVSTDCEEGLMVMGDRSLLITAVANLITNAVNYSPEQTPVSVSVKMTDGDTVAIRVTDRGIGISLADQERIFERFFRVDKARSRSTGGTGLGLAIVKHVVANHKGAIKIWSRPGTGSTFTLELPALKKEG